jgi:hypothetical protein
MLKSWSSFLTCIFFLGLFLQPLLGSIGPAVQYGGGRYSTSAGKSGLVDENPSLTLEESTILALVNGTEAYASALEIEAIGLNHTLSDYSFRAGGSKGANETAKYIAEQFQDFGLETRNESFQFTNWDLLSEPTLYIDEDGNPATTYDQTNIDSFQSTHYSWPTPQDGAFEDLVVLALPPAANISEIGLNPIDGNTWNTIDTTNKILLTGREVVWSSSWETLYRAKLYSQPPAAVILTWWYDWMSFTPMMSGSTGGRPLSPLGPYYWNLNIPVGGVDYDEGLWIRSKESNLSVSAGFKIESIIDSGPHYNIIGKLRGCAEPNKSLIVCGHYDSVMTPGFCDNAAGTAGVIEAARAVAYAVKNDLYHPRYDIVFVAFDGEESGGLGSMYYIKQHKAEMASIVAVICLDCIGNENLIVYPTNPGAGGLDLDQLMLQSASDLGVNATLATLAQARALPSDHESFRDPIWANDLHWYWWRKSLGINDATPVASSSLFTSEPLLYSDKWSTGTPGWIHTAWDNSTSTSTLDWVEINNLENHVKVAVLTTIRVSPDVPATPRNIVLRTLAPYKTVVGKPYAMRINVTVQNQGSYVEYVDVTVYANSTLIRTAHNLQVSGSGSTEVTVTWNTSESTCGRYVISADVSVLPDETNTTDNTVDFTGVLLTIGGDISGASGQPDGRVDMRDIAAICRKFGSRPTDTEWNPIMDIDGDDTVSRRDIDIACINFGKHVQ